MSTTARQIVTVAQDGSADHRTIQGAINSLADRSDEARVIKIAKGTYREKIYVEKGNIILEGAGADETIITYPIARDIWRCRYNDDWGVATLNIGASDITLRRLTVENGYGFGQTDAVIIKCPLDTTQPTKTISRGGHQMALRTMNGATRLKAIDCRFRAYGGDTVSPWDVDNGMWYFSNCDIEGSVDMYCPRGWAWAENCRFTAHGGTAIIWHDGSKHEDSRSVLVNCTFSGYDGFYLGRYHRDAQMYLVGCVFDANMRDREIYRVPTSNTIRWGHRVYYADCKRKGDEQYAWYANNLPAGLEKNEINVHWVFGDRWNPLLDK
ncbi:MAG TPA: pectinesterase family protein [Phnomibacter sp.]|nr:pectinesterase family protein [Phnomibacter sp.]